MKAIYRFEMYFQDVLSIQPQYIEGLDRDLKWVANVFSIFGAVGSMLLDGFKPSLNISTGLQTRFQYFYKVSNPLPMLANPLSIFLEGFKPASNIFVGFKGGG